MTTTKRTYLRTVLHGLLAAVCLFCLFSCTEEYGSKKDPVDPTPNTPGDRQEVLLTLKNKLKPLTKATDSLRTKASTDLIATDAENEIASMDVFVFGSDEENGIYSFRELLYYRADGSSINQEWASSFDIQQKDDNESTALLALQKGLYVKLYVIANQSGLTGSIDGLSDVKPSIEYKQFSALVTGETGDKGYEVLMMGLPTEDNFKHFRTPLLNPDKDKDVLLTPLTMVGSHVTPIDLTDFTANARLQVGFKLNRLSARFDVVNDAAASKLTIKSISMANGRSGVGFFPIKPYQAEPSLKDDLITYPPRKFEGAQTAADKLVKGAFYSYPSPIEDKAYLIVSGIYAVNLTERKEVTYRVPFKQVGKNGTANYIEIAYNHRYTLYITGADEYHLDVDIRVADWDEAGSIDDYQPDTAPDSLYIEIAPKNGKYNNDEKSVSLYLDPTNFFTVTTASNAEIGVSHRYDGGDTQHDWLQVEFEKSYPNVKAIVSRIPELKGATVFQYKVSPNPQYKGDVFPRGHVIFQDKATGREQLIHVDPFSKPEIHAVKKEDADKNPNEYVDTTRVLTMHRALGSTFALRVVCPDGSKPDNVPAWLTVEKNAALSTAASSHYDITIKDTTGTSVAQTYELKFTNEKQEDLFTPISIELRKADIDRQFQTINPGNKLNADSTELTMPLIADNKFQLNTTSINGVKVDMNFGEGKPHWLKHDGEPFTRAGDVRKPLVFQLDNDHLVGAAPVDITITNNYQGENFTFRVIPDLQAPALPQAATSSTCADNKYNYSAATLELYKLSAKASETVLEVKTPGDCEVVNPYSAWLQVRKESIDYQTCRFTFSIAKDATPPTDGAAYNVTLRNMTDNSKTTVVKVSPKYYPVPTVTKESSNPAGCTLNGTTIKIYKLTTGTTSFTINVNSSLGGSKISYTGEGITLPGTVSDTGTKKLYTLTANALGKGTLRVMNNQDNNRYTDYTVEVINPTITASNQNVTAANSGATNISVACALPVTATPQWGTNTPWFDITQTHTAENGKIVITQKDNTNTIMKQVTIRLTNDGGITKDIVVTPTGFVAPKLSPNSGSLYYSVKNATTTFTVTKPAGGIGQIKSSNTAVATASISGTTVTVTAKGSGTADISVPNGSSGTVATYRITVTNPTITASNQNVTAANSGTTDISVACAIPVTATPQWGSNTPWFDITTQHTVANGKIIITQRNNTNTIMKAVTIHLTNDGGVTKDILVTPTGFVAPTLSANSGSLYTNVRNVTTTFTVSKPAGSIGQIKSSNTNIATALISGTTVTVTAKGSGTAKISVPNGSSSTAATYEITVTNNTKLYNGELPWYYFGFLIAPVDAGSRSEWNDNLSSMCPSGWHVPSADEWCAILGGISKEQDAAPAVYNEYEINSVFTPFNCYWSTTERLDYMAYSMFYYGSLIVSSSYKSSPSLVRCVAPVR